MIDGGLRLFSEGRAPILRSLTAGMVTREAGFHRQTFYRHWSSQAAFAGDLVDRVFAVPADPDPEGTDPTDPPPGRTFEESVAHQATRDFDVVGRDPTSRVRVGLLALGQIGDDRSREAATRFYARAQGDTAKAYARILATWDRQVHPPHTLEDLTAGALALLVGTRLHVLVDGDASAAPLLLGRRLPGPRHDPGGARARQVISTSTEG